MLNNNKENINTEFDSKSLNLGYTSLQPSIPAPHTMCNLDLNNISQDRSCRVHSESHSDPAYLSCDLRQLAELRLWASTYEASSKTYLATRQRINSSSNLINHLAGINIQLELTKQAKAHSKKMMFASYKRAFPHIYNWAKDTPGLASSSDLAWLMAIIGEPCVKTPYKRTSSVSEDHICSSKCGNDNHLVSLEPSYRSVSQLWQYCGHGSIVNRYKGMSQAETLSCGNTHAKMLIHRLAESCVKMIGSETRKKSPYRDTYEQAREAKLNKNEWSDGRKHGHAIRITAKTILKDLWIVSNSKVNKKEI